MLNILLTNDDGIHAPGMDALCEALHDCGHIWVVAPHEEKSACGHGITLKDPLRIIEIERDDEIERYAINGTPADCVKMAVQQIMPVKPDVVLSGINLGPNLGVNVIYSGTVAGAMEASIQGVPAVALSLTTYTQPYFEALQSVAQQVCKIVEEGDVDVSDMLLNINAPNIPLNQIQGVACSTQGVSKFIEDFEKREDIHGRPYFWMAGDKEAFIGPDHSDEKCVEQGFVSVTPLHYDLTDYRCLPHEHPVCPEFPLQKFMSKLKLP